MSTYVINPAGNSQKIKLCVQKLASSIVTVILTTVCLLHVKPECKIWTVTGFSFKHILSNWFSYLQTTVFNCNNVNEKMFRNAGNYFQLFLSCVRPTYAKCWALQLMLTGIHICLRKCITAATCPQCKINAINFSKINATCTRNAVKTCCRGSVETEEVGSSTQQQRQKLGLHFNKWPCKMSPQFPISCVTA